MHVLIGGGGVGGLCLAQGLRKFGISATVFERDRSTTEGGQGYRLRIDADGDAALRACLSDPLYALYCATGCRNGPPVGAFDSQLNLIYRLPQASGNPASPAEHLSVNRLTLRQILVGELGESVRFDHALIRFEQNDEGVRAHFANGETITGDVLVAAEGVHSAIRRQLLPEAEIVDTGMRCVYGLAVLTPELRDSLPESLLGGFTPCLGLERRTLTLGIFQPARSPVEAAEELAPGVVLDPVPDYLTWLFVAPCEAFPSGSEASAAGVHDWVRQETQDWHPALRRVLEVTDSTTVFQTAIRTARPVPAWPASRVTLLGDAIHVMTPAGGIGANTALQDAARLTRGLAGVTESSLIAAIAIYESDMRVYGFAAAERSLRGAAPLYRLDTTVWEK